MIAEDDDEASKTEEPSERKISKAKEEGDIAISQDAKSFIMLLGMLFVIWLVLPLMFKWFYMFSLKFVENPDAIPTDGRHIRLLLYNTVIALMKILGIPFAIFMVLGIFASVAQTGFVYAPKKLEPNWNKLNIFAAMTQFINMKKIVESLKGIIKITVIAFIGVLVIRPYLEKVNLMPGMETMAILSFIHKIVVLLIFTVVIAVLVIAVADYAYQKYQHLKKLRMTKQEVKDEYKQMEGDPLVKSRIRQVRMERARHRMMDAVPRADVVIVNPTHYAVALEYKMEKMDAPVVVAKGLDNLALRIREIAEEHDIPIVENPPLARALFASVELDQSIPAEHFKAVAEASPLPVVLYNVPSRTGKNMEAATPLRLAEEFPGKIIGIKEASGDIDQIRTIIDHKPEGFQVVSGDDALTRRLIGIGAEGVISVVGNALPRLFSDMVHRSLANPSDPEAADTDTLLQPLDKALFADGNPSGIKCLLNLLGLADDVLRLPLVPVSAETRKAIENVLPTLPYLN